ncbi:MAG: stage 0 sporulation family protein [Clostridiales bacterium]|nr:stage 0 sporulation family protein [Clostridiales bacterium]
MTTICGIRFREAGKVYYFDPAGLELQPGQAVIVETARGIEHGEVVMGNTEMPEERLTLPLKRVLRLASSEDSRQAAENVRREQEAFDICLQKIAAHKLEMKLVDVEYTFDRSKILFYFKADGRVDFRELVKDLASVFRTRIELRQIGVRDEAKMLGGLGICGRPFCCSTHLNEFQPVSIKMAKEQGLSLNPTKISGTCGRLMCCLKYEQESYEALLGSTPRPGTLVQTASGRGIVTDVNLLRGHLTVRLQDDEQVVVVPKQEVKVLREGGPRGKKPEPEAPPPQETT